MATISHQLSEALSLGDKDRNSNTMVFEVFFSNKLYLC